MILSGSSKLDFAEMPLSGYVHKAESSWFSIAAVISGGRRAEQLLKKKQRRVATIMFGRLAQLAKRVWDCLACAAHQLFRRANHPTLTNSLTDALADLPRGWVQ
jgi:hypothetical protein